MYGQDYPEAVDPGPEDNPDVDSPAALLYLVKDGAWLDAQEFPPVQWAVPGVIPEGFGLLTGPPKIGKSWAVLDIALAVSSGGSAFSVIHVGPKRPVLYLALEDGEKRLQSRCRKLMHNEPIPTGLNFVTDIAPMHTLPLIEAWLDQHEDDNPLVILDTLGKVMPPANPGEGAYQRDYRIGGKLKGIMRRHEGATLLVVHHVRKGMSSDWMDSTSGTNGLNGAADFTINISRDRSEEDGVLRVTGRDVTENEYAVACRDGHWTLTGSDLIEAAKHAAEVKATTGVGDHSAEIIQWVSEQDGPVMPKQVVDALGLSSDIVRRYMARLADAGRLRKVGYGKYEAVKWDTDPSDLGVPPVPVSHFQDALDAPPLSGGSQSDGSGTEGQLGHTHRDTCRLHPDPKPDACFTCEENAR